LEEYKFPSVAGALAMMGYAKALNSQGENEMAMDRFEDALRQIRGCPNSAILEARAYWWMGNSMIEQGNNADARIMLEKARPIFERIDNHRMMGIIDQTLRKISLAESMRSDDTPS